MTDFVDRLLGAPGPRLRPLAPNVFDPGAPRLPLGPATKVPSSARRAGPAPAAPAADVAVSARHRKPEGPPCTGRTRANPRTQRAHVPGATGQARISYEAGEFLYVAPGQETGAVGQEAADPRTAGEAIETDEPDEAIEVCETAQTILKTAEADGALRKTHEAPDAVEANEIGRHMAGSEDMRPTGGDIGRGVRPAEHKKTSPVDAEATRTAVPQRPPRADAQATPRADGKESRSEDEKEGSCLVSGKGVPLTGTDPWPSASSQRTSDAGSCAQARGVGHRQGGDAPPEAAVFEAPRAQESQPSATTPAIGHRAVPVGSRAENSHRSPTADEPPVRRRSRPERPAAVRTRATASAPHVQDPLRPDPPLFPTEAGAAPQSHAVSPHGPGTPVRGPGVRRENFGVSIQKSSASPPRTAADAGNDQAQSAASPARTAVPEGLPVSPRPSLSPSRTPAQPSLSRAPSPSQPSQPSQPSASRPSSADALPQPPPVRAEWALAPAPHIRTASLATTRTGSAPPPATEHPAHRTVVRVTIDQLVVRAAPPRPGDDHPTAPHRKPRLTLEEYLGRRA